MTFPTFTLTTMGESENTTNVHSERTPAPLNENHLINFINERKTKLNMNFAPGGKVLRSGEVFLFQRRRPSRLAHDRPFQVESR